MSFADSPKRKFVSPNVADKASRRPTSRMYSVPPCVAVDHMTKIPLDLYRDLMKAGEERRTSGQHYLYEEPRKPRKSMPRSRGPRPKLVNRDSESSSSGSSSGGSPAMLSIPAMS